MNTFWKPPQSFAQVTMNSWTKDVSQTYLMDKRCERRHEWFNKLSFYTHHHVLHPHVHDARLRQGQHTCKMVWLHCDNASIVRPTLSTFVWTRQVSTSKLNMIKNDYLGMLAFDDHFPKGTRNIVGSAHRVPVTHCEQRKCCRSQRPTTIRLTHTVVMAVGVPIYRQCMRGVCIICAPSIPFPPPPTSDVTLMRPPGPT